MNKTVSLYSYHSLGVFFWTSITCISFILTEYCPALLFLDNIHLKHILLLVNVALFGLYFMKHKEKLFVDEVFQIIICGIVLYGISLFFQIKNDSLKLYSLEEMYYLIAPLILVWIIFNFVSLKRIPVLVDIMFLTSCFCFIVRFGSEFSFEALREISFVESNSPFESDLAQFFFLFCVFYLYTKQKAKVVLSATLCFFCFKRFTVVALILVLVGFVFIPHRKSVPKWIYFATVVVFVVAPFFTYYMCTDTFASWFNQRFGVDFNLFTMTRFFIINTVIDADLINYGLGTVTNYLENRGVEGQLNMHNDILRIYMETTIVGSFVFARQYFHTFKNNMFSFLIIFYAFVELFVAHYLGPGTISFWLIAYLLVFYFNAFENVSTDEEREMLLRRFTSYRKKVIFKICR